MNIADCFKVGYILKPHGLKGEVTIAVEHDSPIDLNDGQSLFVEENGRLIPYFIEFVSSRGEKAFIKFEDVNSLEAANAISKKSLYLPKKLRPKSGKGEFYDDEVNGFEVYDDTLGLVGKIVEVVAAGPNKLLSIDYDGKEVLIPVNGPFIKTINKAKKKIEVDLPEGFFDL